MTRRVLVARLDSMGDVLLAGPAVRAVASAAEVILLCGPRGAAAADLLPGVSERLVWEAPWISNPAPDADAAHLDALVERLRAARIDGAVILTSFHQSPLPLALLLRAAGISRVTGASVDYPGSLLDVRLRPGEDLPEEIPESERALAIAAAAGFPSSDDGRLRVKTPPRVDALTGREPYFVLHPGADAPARRWTTSGFARTARLLVEHGQRVVLTGGPEDRDLTAAIAHEARASGITDLAGSCRLPELAGVLSGARVLIAGNTGPAHLAAAVGTPVVSLFSPVVPAVKWAPHGVPVRILGDQRAACRDTRARECPVPGHPCLARVTAEEAVAAALELGCARGGAEGPEKSASAEAAPRSPITMGASE